jgi:hypothetical protein
LNEKSDALD